MRVVFFDKLRETFVSVGGATMVRAVSIKCNGRLTKVWLVDFVDKKQQSFKCKDFDIQTVEI